MLEVHPPIQIVDQDDIPLRGGTMDEAQFDGLWHRIARVMVWDENRGLYLLQKVSPNPYYNGGLWNTTASGHVDEGESYEEAAERELKEEMGIEGLKLEEVDYYRAEKTRGERRYRRHNKTFLARAALSKLNIRPNESEVESIEWASAEQLSAYQRAQPVQMTDGLSRFVMTMQSRL